MDENDAQMQSERASQAEDVDVMELEHIEEPKVPSISASSTMPDADMEIHDVESEGRVGAMQDSTKPDLDMTEEMVEQAHLTEERDGKDFDSEIDVLHPQDFIADVAFESTIQNTSKIKHQLVGKPFENNDKDIAENGQIVLERVLVDSGIDRLPLDQTTNSVQDISLPPDSANSIPSTEEGHVPSSANQDDSYADAFESHEPQASMSAQTFPESNPSESSVRRPDLQKDYLSHVDVFEGCSALPNTAYYRDTAPHVSLICDNREYSLFRPSSSPSGDDEQVLFGLVDETDAKNQDENRIDNDAVHKLYYSPLEMLIEKLHQAFPSLANDGDNEMTLDFGILDMQISEDNIYCKQLSLHDLDRIRVGMCQPELDRLQISVVMGKRFASRFNELAEHCYRMYAGSEEDDSGTVNEETAAPLPDEDFANEGVENYEEEETPTNDEAVAADENVVRADFPTGERQDTLIPLERLNRTGQAELDYTGEEVETDGDDIHPPSDEPYEDPEFAHIDEGNGDAVDYDKEAEDDETTIQGNEDSSGAKTPEAGEVLENVLETEQSVHSGKTLEDGVKQVQGEVFEDIAMHGDGEEGNEQSTAACASGFEKSKNYENEYREKSDPSNHIPEYVDDDDIGQEASGNGTRTVKAALLGKRGDAKEETKAGPDLGHAKKRSRDEVDELEEGEQSEHEETVPDESAKDAEAKRHKTMT